MFTINDNYLKLQGSYLFSNIAKKVAAFQERNPGAEIIRLGIGDVTQPLAPAIIEALHKAVDEMGNAATFHVMPLIKDMSSSAMRSLRMITRREAVKFMRMRSSFPTEQNVTAEISRRSSD